VKDSFAENGTVYAHVLRLEKGPRVALAPQISRLSCKEDADILTIPVVDIVEGPLLALSRGSDLLLMDVVLSPEVS
jgi:hypothetical protein